MFWKTAIGRCIYQTNQGLKVFENPFFRWLTLDSDALQTVLNKKKPYKPELSYIKPLILAAQMMPSVDCCMLGLGGGAAAHALAPFMGNARLTIVEENVEVIDVASRFFKMNELQNLTLIHQDANEFVQTSQTQYQHLLIDLFGAKYFPTHCVTERFFSHCKRLVQTQGILAVNLANKQEHGPILHLIKALFKQNTITILAKKSTNVVILAGEHCIFNLWLHALQQQEKLQRFIWDPHWGFLAELNPIF